VDHPLQPCQINPSGPCASMVRSPSGSGPRPAKIGKGTAEETAPFHSAEEPEDVRLAASRESWLRWTLTVASLVAAWWTAALIIALVLKRTVGSPHARHAPGPFPYPFALTSFVNLLTTGLSWILSRVTEHHLPPPPRMMTSEVLKILVIGCLQGVELGCNNKATEFLPVSTKVMLHSMFVLFVMVSARLWGLEPLGHWRCISASLILIGGIFQGWSAERRSVPKGQQTQQLHGALLMLFAMVLGSQRWALIQIVVHSEVTSALGQLTKLQYSTRTLPTAGVICFIGALIFERGAFSAQALKHQQLWIAIPSIGLCVITLTLSELSVVRRTSAVALQVLATLHQIPIVVVSAVLFHEHVSLLSTFGFVCCILAAFVYAAARGREKLNEQPAVEVEQEDDTPAATSHGRPSRNATEVQAASVEGVELSVSAGVQPQESVQSPSA